MAYQQTAARPFFIGKLPLLAGLSVVLALVAFSGPLSELVYRWANQEEYGHGFFIPLISLWLLWQRRDAVLASIGQPSLLGVGAIAISALMLIVGEFGAFRLTGQVGFLVCLAGIALAAGGPRLLRVCLLPIAFMAFAIPLPYFFDALLSYRLQLLSSEFGVFFIRLFQVPVYLEGNVIDFGIYKLQVVDACSGLRYLYPLLSLGFLAAYMFNAPLWQRAVVFASTVPITIVMNSARIGMIGLLVDRWGIGMAEGLLHLFEGWVIFLACGTVLWLEMLVFARVFNGKGFFESVGMPTIRFPASSDARSAAGATAQPLAASVAILAILSISVFAVTQRQEVIPDRQRFVTFPSAFGEWQGRTSQLEPIIEAELVGDGLDDYILADYTSASGGPPLNLYVAYFASQREGSTGHTPDVCIPGGGWAITQLDRRVFDGSEDLGDVPYNRAVIERGSTKQVVYYWFQERGRRIANEYFVKWHIMADAMVHNRTDGAMVRLVTPVLAGESEQDADLRLQGFLKDLIPQLPGYLPGMDATGT